MVCHNVSKFFVTDNMHACLLAHCVCSKPLLFSPFSCGIEFGIENWGISVVLVCSGTKHTTTSGSWIFPVGPAAQLKEPDEVAVEAEQGSETQKYLPPMSSRGCTSVPATRPDACSQLPSGLSPRALTEGHPHLAEELWRKGGRSQTLNPPPWVWDVEANHGESWKKGAESSDFFHKLSWVMVWGSRHALEQKTHNRHADHNLWCSPPGIADTQGHRWWLLLVVVQSKWAEEKWKPTVQSHLNSFSGRDWCGVHVV